MEKYNKSLEHLKKVQEIIPLGSQTFSKSFKQYPLGVSPLFIEKGEASRVWDIDGNEYIDFVNSLLAVSIGYNNTEINDAVKKQLEIGVSFSLPTKIEYDVAELLIEMVPCAEMVRFGKNGSDVTSAAVRLARGYTGKQRIAVCGYHGWHDWYIGTTTKDLGVPTSVSNLTHTFKYNDIESLSSLLEKYHNQFAAIILEPMNFIYPKKGFLEGVRALADKHNIILIFDEICTGLRYAKGGAQELFGVQPDLCVLGKGLANGFPLSALLGRKKIMEMCSEIFFSGTFGGEAVSLAAAKQVLTMVRDRDILEKIRTIGQKVILGVEKIILDNRLDKIISISGHPSWSFITINGRDETETMLVKTLFLQEMFNHGVLILFTHNISYAHSQADVDYLLGAYIKVFRKIKSALENGTLINDVKCAPLEVLFKVR